ncbi:TRAP transporter, 4TM/12TM fusion protein [Natrialba hulunbeirensis JCM 10989]|uniref:TRAP transporter, 4TM/12TM fusion protein n=1 Tax=Natrialba hulunbeirensis JCM 10989 TaxID=1227493 RepID=M0A0G6_9EURY|nr:TRAP transporter fused permease subunit [Natrialba hulunbeirensis]ELY92079.1 TRAP transporter, 4TM/12TM fusion protein [Natrialba hulunbeirensis JCM 10989]
MVYSTADKNRLDIARDAITLFAIVTWVWILYYAFTQQMDRILFTVIFLGAIMLVYLGDELIDAIEDGNTLDIVLMSVSSIVTIGTTVYMYTFYETLLSIRVGTALTHEYAIAAAFVLVVLYLSYRAYGLTFLAVIVAAILYGVYGNYAPGILRHGGFSLNRTANIMVLDFQGVYGSISRIIATWVALFLLYAGLMRGFGAFDLIMRLALRAAELVRSGVALSAVTASIIIGSITGSQAANTAITGSFTIPLMKESGIDSEVAGGIESVASTGGQIMPPVMGAAAFVMASLLGITYLDVLVAGLIPAAIFYGSVIIAVHYTGTEQLRGQDLDVAVTNHFDERLTRRQLAVQGARFGIPFAILIWTLGVLQWTVLTSALYTVVAMLLTGFGFPLVATVANGGDIKAEFVDLLGQAAFGFREGAIILAPIAIIIASINGVVDILEASGVPGVLSLALLDLSGGVMIVAVILAMIISIILGLGMPTVAAYVVVAALIAPALVQQFFVPDLAAHYFVLYAAILSGLTPPIAIAVVVATGIADSNFWRTCFEALKISAPIYILPFAFIYNPELVVGGWGLWTFASGLIALIGAFGVSHGLNYHGKFFHPSPAVVYPVKGVYFVAGLLAMVFPNTAVRLACVALILVLVTAQLREPILARFGSGSTADSEPVSGTKD